MLTFMDWCKQTQANLEREIDLHQGDTDSFGLPSNYLNLLCEAVEKVESAVELYELYIESTQIEELADVEGVGE